MTTKSAQNMIRRFTGTDGRQRLIDAVCQQSIVAADRALAQKLVRAGSLLNAPCGKEIISEGNTDNDIYLIVSGQVAVSVNGRLVANRSAGTHVGEMALIDPTARRSATVVAVERTTLLRIPEAQVSRLASKYPELWRRIAVQLARRLRERSRFFAAPRAEPTVFIGSSGEALKEATFVSESLRRRPAVPKLWTEGVFQLSKTAIEDLWRMTSECDFAVIFLTPDDMTVSRGKKKPSPRDNAVLELGLFMGALGRERAFIVTPKGVDIKIPTDLLGVTRLQYKPGAKKTLGKRLSPIACRLWQIMKRVGPR